MNDDTLIPYPKWRREFFPGSERHAFRIMAAGLGPPLIRISPRCMGVRLGDHRAWVQKLAAAAV